MVKELSMTKKAIDVFCKAFICEPCNDISDMSRSYKYISRPTTMPLYLEAFLHPKQKGIKLDKSIDLSICYGCGSGYHHKMLACEKKNQCCICKKTMCLTCTTKTKNKMYCLDCYKSDLLQPYEDNNSECLLFKTESEMRCELLEAGQQLESNVPFDVLQGLYDNLESLKLHRKLVGNVKYPIKVSGKCKNIF